MKGKTLKLSAVLLALLCTLTACGSSKSESFNSAAYNSFDAGGYGYVTSGATADTAAYAEEAYDYEYENAQMQEAGIYKDDAAPADNETLDENTAASNRKLIKTVDITVETENYDTLLGNLAKQVSDLGGYIEYQYEYNGRIYTEYNDSRSANWSIRIPVQHLDEFVVLVGNESNIINKTERVEDVTLQYVDLESRKTALLTEQKRLLELLEQAENVEDIITIEQRLSEVRYALENMESQLRLLDNKIDYSTISLSIQEVKREVRVAENSVWDRIRNGFTATIYNLGDGIVNIFVWFVVNIPYIVIWIVVIIAVIAILKSIIKRRKLKKQRRLQKEAEAETKQEEK